MALFGDSKSPSDKLTIVNGSTKYKISKQLICSKIPYFDKMCSSNMKESVESKVFLDLDEYAFALIIYWVKTGVCGINRPNITALYECADYLMIDPIKEACLHFLRNNFDIKQSSPDDKKFFMLFDLSDPFWNNFDLLTLDNLLDNILESVHLNRQLSAFFSRTFNIITSSPSFTKLPFKLVHYICCVDAPIKSEREIFDTFKMWIDNQNCTESVWRKFWTRCKCTEDERDLLMETIRWPYVSPDDLTYIKNGYKSLGGNFERFVNIHVLKMLNDRRVEDLLTAIFCVNSKQIVLHCYRESIWIPLGVYRHDDSMSLSLYSENNNTTDIIYESGRKGIRVDWSSKKFRYLQMTGSPSPYYNQLFQHYISLEREPLSDLASKNLRVSPHSESFPEKNSYLFINNSDSLVTALLHQNGSYSLVDRDHIYKSVPSYQELAKARLYSSKSLAARDAKNVYLITAKNALSLYITNIYTTKWKVALIGDKTRPLDDLELTSLNDQIFVVNKSSKEIFIPCNVDGEYRLKLHHQILSNMALITVTSASIPKSLISSC